MTTDSVALKAINFRLGQLKKAREVLIRANHLKVLYDYDARIDELTTLKDYIKEKTKKRKTALDKGVERGYLK